MAADPLCGRMNQDVRSEIDRSTQRAGGPKGVVHNQWNTSGVGDVRQCLEVWHVESGIPDRLNKEQPGTCVDGGAHLIQIMDVHELRLDAPLRQRVFKKVVGAAVEGLGRHQVVSGTCQIQDRQRRGCLTTGHGECCHTPFELRDPLLEHITGRIHDPGVDVAEHPKPEEVCGMLRVVEDVARSGVNRHGSRVRRRVRRLARV
jgi:hypothetical protein